MNRMAEQIAGNNSEQSREKTIIKTSVVGIVTNVLLAAFKAVVGLMANSIAIVLDAVNNISDAGSSLITIVGTKLAGKDPDKKHPFGYGRIEYLTAMIISAIILYAGITSLIESVKQIIHPETPDYSAVSLIIVAVAVVVKIILSRYVKRHGEKARSDSLVNSGKEAMLDAVISTATLVAAGIFLIFHVSLEAWLGAVISLIIVKSGIEMLRDTISQILGEQNDPELAKNIKQTVAEFPEVQGAYDLVLNNYGPDAWNGSIHVEVPDTCSADQLDRLIRNIQNRVYTEHRVVLTAVGVYSVNTKDEESIGIREKVREIALSHEHVLQIHGFYLDEVRKTIHFDIITDFAAPDANELYEHILTETQEAYPDHAVSITLDTDVSD